VHLVERLAERLVLDDAAISTALVVPFTSESLERCKADKAECPFRKQTSDYFRDFLTRVILLKSL